MSAKRLIQVMVRHGILILLIGCITLTASANEKKVKRGESKNYDDYAIIPRRKVSFDDDKIKDIYARLIRYQVAGQDYENAENNSKVNRSDYLKISITEMTDLTKDKFIENADIIKNVIQSESLNFYPEDLCLDNDDECLLMYQVNWENKDINDNKNILNSDFDKKSKYREYSVTIEFKDKQISYKALAVYLKNDDKYPTIIDPIIPNINDVTYDFLPPLRSPWDEYVLKPHYWKLQKDIKEKINKGESLIPKDAPVGYLPGDDIKEDKKLSREYYESMNSAE